MEKIDITSEIRYIEERSNPSAPLFLFSYKIEIANKSKSSIQLINRHWKITDGNGVINTVNGKGVVGLQPIIKTNDKFEYSSFFRSALCLFRIQKSYIIIEFWKSIQKNLSE